MSDLPTGWEDAALEAANLDMSNDESPRRFAKIIALRTANRLAALQARRIAELEQEVAALRVDAERYRFLRDAKNRRPLREFGIRRCNIYMEQFDASIDAAKDKQ